jgi:RNA polymerase primary sigma factor
MRIIRDVAKKGVIMRYGTKETWEDARLYYQYIKDINKYPLITKPEERALLMLVRGGNRRAIDKLICSNLKFVINVAFMYRGQGLSLTELINEGNIGLIEAAKRFDLSRKIRFISYAVWWIRQSITRSISEKARLIRISAEKELVLRRINKYGVKMKQIIGAGLKIDSSDLGKKMGYSSLQMDKILEMGQHYSSLNEPVDSNSESTLLDVIEDCSQENAEQLSIQESRNRFLLKNLNKLCKQEKKVLCMYFGVNYHRALSLEDIGDIIGLSKERVRQIKEKGLANLKKAELPRDLLLAA